MKITVVYDIPNSTIYEAAEHYYENKLTDSGFDDIRVKEKLGLSSDLLIDKIEHDPEFCNLVVSNITRALSDDEIYPWDYDWMDNVQESYPAPESWLTPIMAEVDDLYEAWDAEDSLLIEHKSLVKKEALNAEHEKMRQELVNNGYVVYRKKPKKSKKKKQGGDICD